MENVLSECTQPPTIEAIRASTTHFKQFVDNSYLCDYQNIIIPTTDGMQINARFIKAQNPSELLIFFLARLLYIPCRMKIFPSLQN